MTIQELLSDIRKMNAVLPEFQREYVWSREQAKQLMVSLYRGYPTGALLFWKTDEPPEIKNNAVITSTIGTTQVILDGQQRLTTLYLLTQDEIPPYYTENDLQVDPRNLYFNLDDEEFRYYQAKRMENNPAWVPVTRIFGGSGEINVFEIAQSRTEDGAEAFEIAQRFSDNLARVRGILDKQYPIQTVPSNAGIDEAIDVFDRVNSLGTKLSDAELALAHITGKWPKARQVLKEKLVEMDAKRFHFDLTFMVRALTAVATRRALFEVVHDTPRAKLELSWTQLSKILDYLVALLPGQAFIHSTDDLQTTNVLVPLISYVDKNGGTFPDEDQLRAGIHWLYAASTWARYSSQTNNRLDHDISIMQRTEDPWSELVNAIIDQRGRIKVTASDFEGRYVTHPLYRMARVAIKARGAIDWFNGTPLAQPFGADYRVHSHHIFPSSLLYSEGGYNSENHVHAKLVNEIANRAVLTAATNISLSNTPPAEYLPTVEKKFPGALGKQFVPTEPTLWQLANYEAFLQQRRQGLADAINQLMDDLTDQEPAEAATHATALIGLGESASLEFKSSLRWDTERHHVNKSLEKVVAKTVAGFLNAEGGILLIGVADDVSVIGIEDDFKTLGSRQDLDGFQQKLVNVINSYIGVEFSSFWRYRFDEVDGSTVAVVTVERCPKPVFLADGDRKEFYARVGGTTQPMDVEAATAYIDLHWDA